MVNERNQNRNQDKLIHSELCLAVAAFCLLVAVIGFVRVRYGLYTDE